MRSASHKATPFQKRLAYCAAGLFLFSLVLVWRLGSLQLWRGRELRAEAVKQYSTVRTLPASRGQIFYSERRTGELYALAANRVFNELYAIPRDIANASSTLSALWPLIQNYGLSRETVAARLGRANDIYEPLLHKLSDEELSPILALNLPGIAAEPETWRFYPEGDTAAHVLGFVGVRAEERVGQYGLEGYLEDDLRGRDGYVEGDVDSSGRLIQSGELRRTEPEAGVDLLLTLDRVVQTYACSRLASRAAELGAAGGDLVIMEPTTGAILAMCSTPAFDPNNYNKVGDIAVYANTAAGAAYEPGSVFKPITMAMAIDQNKVLPGTTYTDTGAVKFGSFTIRNSDNEAHGEVDMTEVLQLSLNTGAIFAEEQIGQAVFRDYVKNFGFGRLAGLELPSEAPGNMKSLNEGRDIYFATASFGQGITVTPVQMAAAYGALANGGYLMKPYIVKEKRRGGAVIESAKPQIMGRPIQLRTSTILSGMLVSVVRAGHAKRAAVPGYRIAAKTGTAQVAEGGEYGANTIHTVAGYGPIDNPAFTMIVKLNHPKAGRFAESTVVPVFGDIAKFLLQYYEIPPDEEVK